MLPVHQAFIEPARRPLTRTLSPRRGERGLVGESSTGRIHLFDGASGKSVPVLDRLRLRPGERSGSGIGIVRAKFGISRDDRTLFLVRDHAEADIWQIELERSPAGK
jgi:hypothetical protein